METYYECPYCRSTFTAKEWNDHNKEAILIFDIDPLPEGIDGGTYDCPDCEERVCGEDLLEV